jgi:hypothetical protein
VSNTEFLKMHFFLLDERYWFIANIRVVFLLVNNTDFFKCTFLLGEPYWFIANITFLSGEWYHTDSMILRDHIFVFFFRKLTSLKNLFIDMLRRCFLKIEWFLFVNNSAWRHKKWKITEILWWTMEWNCNNITTT